ncbi:hypothetical protein KSS87_019302 [Heliosperma pusillum]|nr:hypothetical protein KSS87_019302 [Heliosperma pusillum]
MVQDILVASISQVMVKSNEKGIQVANDSSEHSLKETLYGDSLRLQQILADFLWISVNFTPAGGQVRIIVKLAKDKIGESIQLANLEFRIMHTGGGISEELLKQMFEGQGDASEEGISLVVSRKLVKLMNGDIQYLRSAGSSTFIISVELPIADKSM